MVTYRYVTYCCGGAPAIFLGDLFYSPLDLGDIDRLATYLNSTVKLSPAAQWACVCVLW